MAFSQDLAWQDLHYGSSTIVDIHVHPGLKVSFLGKTLLRAHRATKVFNPFSVRTDIPKLRTGGVKAMIAATYVPERMLFDDCWALKLLRYARPRIWQKLFSRPYAETAFEMMGELEEEVAKSQGALKMAKSVAELNHILEIDDPPAIAIIHGIEGAHILENDLSIIDALFDRGVAYMTLAHFYANGTVNPVNSIPPSFRIGNCFQGEPDVSKGLTAFGEQVVEKMIDIGMMIDITHCTPVARKRIYEIVGNRAPLLATHVGAYAINPDLYNLRDWEIRRISESGGMIGIIFMNYWLAGREGGRGLNDISHTIEHLVRVGGEDHIGIGSDFDGFTDPPDDMMDSSQLPALTRRLMADGFSPQAISKLLGQNALRVLREGWKKV